tara:strand:+ start:426 stop:1097 length:672 start_codon:yes stop_codon:yes gene_type:complete
MSRVRADRITDRAATGAPTFPNGAVITGIATATTFDGNATTATTATNAQGLSGTPDITVQNITGVAATFTGVLTYEDVTNIDSIGIVTARSGVDFNGNLRESVNIVASKLSDATDINLANGMVHYFTTTESTTSTPNIMSTVGINTALNTGDTISVNIFTTAAAGGYSARVSIDGVLTGITTYWSGGSAPSAGGSSGKDVYTYQIVKTASATYDVLASLNNFA